MNFNKISVHIAVILFIGTMLALVAYNVLRMYNLKNTAEQPALVKVDPLKIRPIRTPFHIEQLPDWHLFKKIVKKPVKVRNTRLNIRLVGVLSSTKEQTARVIIEKPSRQQAFYKKGDTIMPNVVLKAIYTDYIVIRNHNADEVLRLKSQKNNKILIKK